MLFTLQLFQKQQQQQQQAGGGSMTSAEEPGTCARALAAAREGLTRARKLWNEQKLRRSGSAAATLELADGSAAPLALPAEADSATLSPGASIPVSTAVSAAEKFSADVLAAAEGDASVKQRRVAVKHILHALHHYCQAGDGLDSSTGSSVTIPTAEAAYRIWHCGYWDAHAAARWTSTECSNEYSRALATVTALEVGPACLSDHAAVLAFKSAL